MFTGIVSDIGTIESIDQRGDLRVKIKCGYDMDGVDMGASIACSGVCLTVVDKGADWFAIDVSGETLSCTAEGQFTAGRRLNLERALKVGDELGGHIVTGHVDGVGEVMSSIIAGDSREVVIRVSKELAPFVAAKGSITVDGVSLTVNAVSDEDGVTLFTLNICLLYTSPSPRSRGLGDVYKRQDILARYLARMEQAKSLV